METGTFHLMTHFWRENDNQTFSAKEVQLYFFLLAEYNRLHRQNPFACSTQRITNSLGISRHTLCRLREKLQTRGLLVYEEGKNLSAVPCYTLLSKSQCANSNTQDSTQDDTQRSQCANTDTQEDTQDGTIIKRDKRNNSSTTIKEELLSLEELHVRLLSDAEWLMRVGELASKQGIDAGEKRIHERLDEFFLYLQTCGTLTKTLSDAQRHFVNWLMKRANGTTMHRKALPADRVGVKLEDNSPEKFKNISGW